MTRCYLVSLDSRDLFVHINSVTNFLNPCFQSSFSNGLGHLRDFNSLRYIYIDLGFILKRERFHSPCRRFVEWNLARLTRTLAASLNMDITLSIRNLSGRALFRSDIPSSRHTQRRPGVERGAASRDGDDTLGKHVEEKEKESVKMDARGVSWSILMPTVVSDVICLQVLLFLHFPD
jgi:hypothetical protein